MKKINLFHSVLALALLATTFGMPSCDSDDDDNAKPDTEVKGEEEGGGPSEEGGGSSEEGGGSSEQGGTVACEVGGTVPDYYVDMGYGTLWAPWNLGASKPGEAGTYFAWGETDTDGAFTFYEPDGITTKQGGKTQDGEPCYCWDNYTLCGYARFYTNACMDYYKGEKVVFGLNLGGEFFRKMASYYGKGYSNLEWGASLNRTFFPEWTIEKYTVEDRQTKGIWYKKTGSKDKFVGDDYRQLRDWDDAATVNWKWKSADFAWATSEEYVQLFCEDCYSREWKEAGEYAEGSLPGYLFTSKANGNKLFLPAAGYVDGSGLRGVGTDGSYWTDLLGESTELAQSFCFSQTSGAFESNKRCLGFTIRPVLFSTDDEY